mmetsp:Transcript_9706/g.18381  ORF Transcript_9706/g.18381 Transcript_9706/m.18381 type:complete len:193 (-) Transcript_9706:1679-2257(-)
MPEASTERMTSDRVTEGSKSKEDVGMRRPKDTALKQQRMKAWQPILDPWYVIATFVVIGVIFVPVGWRLNQISNDVVEVKLEYDAYDDPNALCGINNTANAGLNCSVTLPISKDMQPPIFLHYEIKNFYQNHKRYEVSRSDSQVGCFGYCAQIFNATQQLGGSFSFLTKMLSFVCKLSTVLNSAAWFYCTLI